MGKLAVSGYLQRLRELQGISRAVVARFAETSEQNIFCIEVEAQEPRAELLAAFIMAIKGDVVDVYELLNDKTATTAYVALANDGYQVVDISDPQQPRAGAVYQVPTMVESSFFGAMSVMAIAVESDLLVVLGASVDPNTISTIGIIAASDDQPLFVGSTGFPEMAEHEPQLTPTTFYQYGKLLVVGHREYKDNNTSTLQLFHLTLAAAPR
ncbi:MAG: hypothetical protein HC876_20250 [Chloroflexaceae bacterium]|nr:hypothetical protein [Chloroflexaceae bacterium]NJO07657.1 hypothetical protein [Chloroflexaceae bacterium]